MKKKILLTSLVFIAVLVVSVDQLIYPRLFSPPNSVDKITIVTANYTLAPAYQHEVTETITDKEAIQDLLTSYQTKRGLLDLSSPITGGQTKVITFYDNKQTVYTIRSYADTVTGKFGLTYRLD